MNSGNRFMNRFVNRFARVIERTHCELLGAMLVTMATKRIFFCILGDILDTLKICGKLV